MSSQGTIFTEIKLEQKGFDQGVASVEKSVESLTKKLQTYESKVASISAEINKAGSGLNMGLGNPARVAALEEEIAAIERLKAVGSPAAIGQMDQLAKLTAALKLEQGELARSAKLQQHWATAVNNSAMAEKDLASQQAKAAAQAAKIQADNKRIADSYYQVGNAAQRTAGELLALDRAQKASASMFRPATNAPMLPAASTFMGSSYSNAVPSNTDALQKNAAAAKSAATAHKEIAATNKHAESSFSSLTPVIISNYLAYLALQTSINSLVSEFARGFSAVEDYKVNVAEMAGFITTYSQKLADGDLSGGFAEAYKYSEQLVQSLEKMDARTIATGEDLKIINQAFVRNRVLLDDGNQAQVQGFLNTANALKMLFPLQKDQMQMNQEIGALMSGQVRAGDKLALVLKAKDPLIKEHIRLWQEEGTVYENIGRLLAGFEPAVKTLAGAWVEVGSALETIHTRILREGFKPVVEDILSVANNIRTSLIDAQGELTPLAKSLQTGMKDAYREGKELAGIITGMAGGWAAATAGVVLYQTAIGEATVLTRALNVATKANPFVMAGTLAVGAGVWAKQYLDEFQAVNDAGAEAAAEIKRLKETIEVPLPTGSGNSFAEAVAASGEAMHVWSVEAAVFNTTYEQTAKKFNVTKVAPPKLAPAIDQDAIDEAAKKAKKAADDYAKSVDALLDKLLPLEAEQQKYAEDLALLNKVYGQGTINAEQYAMALGTLERGTTEFKEKQEQAKEEVKALAKAMADSEKAITSLENYITDAAGKEAEALRKVNDEYWRMIDNITLANSVGGKSDEWAESMLAKADEAHARNIAALAETEKEHKEKASEVAKLWEHAYERMTDTMADWLASNEVSLDSFYQSFSQMVSQMVATWVMGQSKMGTAEKMSTGGTAGILGTVSSGANPLLGGASAAYGIYSEMMNPGSFANSLGALQTGLSSGVSSLFGASGGSYGVLASNTAGAGGSYGVLASDVAGGGAGSSIAGLSASAFGSLLAGAGTFAMGMLAGQDFDKAAVSGAGAGGGFWGGMAISGGNPIVGILGAVLGSQLGGLMGGGEHDDRYNPNLLSGLTDNTWSRYGGFDAVGMDANPRHYSYDAANKGLSAYTTGIGSIQEQFDSQVEGLKGQMSDAAWEAFTSSLESMSFADPLRGNKVKVSDAAVVTEAMLTEYAAQLTTGLNASLKAALPVIANELVGDNSAYGLLTDELQTAIQKTINGGSFSTEQLGQLQTYLGQISQATSPIAEILATKGLSEYELSLRQINQQFDAYGAQLEAAGIDLSKYTDFEKAKGYALDEANAKEAERLRLIQEEAVALQQENAERALALQQKQAAAIAPIDEALYTHGFNEYQAALHNIDVQMEEYANQLREAGNYAENAAKVEQLKTLLINDVYGKMAQDAASAAEKTAQEATGVASDLASKALATAKEALSNSFSAEKNRLQEEHNALLKEYGEDLDSINGTINDLGGYVSRLKSARESMDLGTDDFARGQYSSASAAVQAALSAVRRGDFSALADLDQSLSIIAKPNQELYASFTDYQRDYLKSYNTLSDLETLTKDQLSADEQVAASLQQQIDIETSAFDTQISLLDSQLNALLGIDTSVLTLGQAIAGYQAAIAQGSGATANPIASLYETILGRNADAAGLSYFGNDLSHGQSLANIAASLYSSDEYQKIKAIRGYAVGTDYVPSTGLALLHQGERVTPAAYNRSDKTNDDLLQEIKQLRADMNMLMGQTAKNTGKSVQLAERWDGDSLRVNVVETV